MSDYSHEEEQLSFTGPDEETAAETDWSVTVVDAAPFAPAHVATALLSRFYDRANNEFGIRRPACGDKRNSKDPSADRWTGVAYLVQAIYIPRHRASDRLKMEKRKLWDILLANYLREGALPANSVFETIDLPSAATFFQLLTQGNRRRYNALAA
ncbi:hypothetical protein BDV30DRAFT_239132 [Aspergillus minisclerotigenes]|uniref:Uncharacterized protein n=1 Tax=Aspergillus minisclerotigenes TaxID=656917 RepID=A0A5N6J1P9_9EURO|nr:hypothetical protein BDV30DRAFT_239132 [Aspergillus minisclerotigenes]